jgi:hypothetical protein
MYINLAWCPRRDSNAELLLRTELFYPLNYGGEEGNGESCLHDCAVSDEHQRLPKANVGREVILGVRKIFVDELVVEQLFGFEPPLDFLLGFFHIARSVDQVCSTALQDRCPA